MLGQTTSYGNHGASVPLDRLEPLIEQADVALSVSLDADGAVGGWPRSLTFVSGESKEAE
jgi:hypothetical protein